MSYELIHIASNNRSIRSTVFQCIYVYVIFYIPARCNVKFLFCKRAQPFDAPTTGDVTNSSKSACVLSPFVSSLWGTALKLSVAKICWISSMNSCTLCSLEHKIVSTEFWKNRREVERREWKLYTRRAVVRDKPCEKIRVPGARVRFPNSIRPCVRAFAVFEVQRQQQRPRKSSCANIFQLAEFCCCVCTWIFISDVSVT